MSLIEKTDSAKETTKTELLRGTCCGEGFLWPLDSDAPQYCPICGSKNDGNPYGLNLPEPV